MRQWRGKLLLLSVHTMLKTFSSGTSSHPSPDARGAHFWALFKGIIWAQLKLGTFNFNAGHQNYETWYPSPLFILGARTKKLCFSFSFQTYWQHHCPKKQCCISCQVLTSVVNITIILKSFEQFMLSPHGEIINEIISIATASKCSLPHEGHWGLSIRRRV